MNLSSPTYRGHSVLAGPIRARLALLVAGALAAGTLAGFLTPETCAAPSAMPQAPGASRAAAPATQPVTAVASEAVNLVLNPRFQEGDRDGDGPAHWQGIDNLVFHRTADPASADRGRVIRVDLDVDQHQAYEWWFKRYVQAAPLSAAPTPIRNSPQPVAERDGGFFWSDYIPIRPGRAYRILVDAKGPPSKVFIRGYVEKPPLSFADEEPAVQEYFRKARGLPIDDAEGRPIRYRVRYQYTAAFDAGGSDQWRTCGDPVPWYPTGREETADIRYLRIMLFPFGKGVYWYDNVRVYEVDPLPGQGRPQATEDEIDEGKVIR